MNTSNIIELIVERAERLLVQHEEIQRTSALLASELKQVRAERDLLKTRMQEATARIDTLLAQLQPEARTEAAASQQEMKE